ncbi:MAG: hypothetical protein HY000_14910 [Planctomycetes bacterium]|nr:hypothetical protein [Planctomycetota bacterium]
MQPVDFTNRKTGRLLKHQRGYWAFVPDPLPPPLELTWELAGEISAADRGLSELAGIGRTLPNPHLLIRPFMSLEAVLFGLSRLPLFLAIPLRVSPKLCNGD